MTAAHVGAKSWLRSTGRPSEPIQPTIERGRVKIHDE